MIEEPDPSCVPETKQILTFTNAANNGFRQITFTVEIENSNAGSNCRLKAIHNLIEYAFRLFCTLVKITVFACSALIISRFRVVERQNRFEFFDELLFVLVEFCAQPILSKK